MIQRLRFACAVLPLLTIPALVPTSRAATAETEIGFLVGAGLVDREVAGRSGSFGTWGPFAGVRAGRRFGETLLWFGDATGARHSTSVGPEDARLFVARTGVELFFAPEPAGDWFVSGAGGWARGDLAAPGADFDRPMVSVGIGRRWRFRQDAFFRWEARADRLLGSDGLGGVAIANGQLLVGWSLAVGGLPPDADGDGVPDESDNCPRTPLAARVDPQGCPLDSDGDGVLDGIDRCPETPRGAKVDGTGCPLDEDADGVFDGIDRCAGTPPGTRVDARGCVPDSDGDGVDDAADRCPETRAGVRVNRIGCPLDSDRDGVPDGIDRCLDTRAGAMVDEQGCEVTPKPLERERLIPEPDRTVVLEGVRFAIDSARLDAASSAILDRVAAALRDRPDVTVLVAGHTDATGGDARNLALSGRRAEAVVEYLVGAGVPAAQLRAKGFGESRPVADNGTEEGRASNRRVELERIP